MTALLTTAPEFDTRENGRKYIVGVSTSDVFREEMAAAEGLEGLRGRGPFELNSQHCDETQRAIHERDKQVTRSI